jgi:hypothetical protein
MSKVLLIFICALVVGGCRADIRPDSIAELKTPSQTAEQRGRELLQHAANLQGVDAFQSHQTYQLTATDNWQGLMPRAINPWPDREANLRLSYRGGSFDARAEFLKGEKKGWTWGLQSWRAYEISPTGEVSFQKNDDASFILPALQFLTEFIFRDHKDNVVSYAGDETINGTTYNRVYVTWNDMEPSDDHDQFVAYIDAKTGMLRKLHFTIRDFAGFAEGTMHYADFREMAGIKIPFQESITDTPTDSPDDYLHRFTISKVEFGVPSLETFQVDKTITPIGDKKVTQR